MKTEDAGSLVPLREHVAKEARDYCARAVMEFKGNKSRAAKALGIHRNTLNKLIKRGGDASRW